MKKKVFCSFLFYLISNIAHGSPWDQPVDYQDELEKPDVLDSDEKLPASTSYDYNTLWEELREREALEVQKIELKTELLDAKTRLFGLMNQYELLLQNQILLELELEELNAEIAIIDYQLEELEKYKETFQQLKEEQNQAKIELALVQILKEEERVSEWKKQVDPEDNTGDKDLQQEKLLAEIGAAENKLKILEKAFDEIKHSDNQYLRAEGMLISKKVKIMNRIEDVQIAVEFLNRHPNGLKDLEEIGMRILEKESLLFETNGGALDSVKESLEEINHNIDVWGYEMKFLEKGVWIERTADVQAPQPELATSRRDVRKKRVIEHRRARRRRFFGL